MSAQLQTISDSLNEIHGLPAWGLKRIHGSMFFLEVGSPVDRGLNRRGEPRIHGEWHFLFEACVWSFRSSVLEPLITSADQPEAIEAEFMSIALGSVSSAKFHIQSSSLSIDFTSGLSLLIEQASEDWIEIDDAEWIFFLPDELAWHKTKEALQLGSIHAPRSIERGAQS